MRVLNLYKLHYEKIQEHNHRSARNDNRAFRGEYILPLRSVRIREGAIYHNGEGVSDAG